MPLRGSGGSGGSSILARAVGAGLGSGSSSQYMSVSPGGSGSFGAAAAAAARHATMPSLLPGGGGGEGEEWCEGGGGGRGGAEEALATSAEAGRWVDGVGWWALFGAGAEGADAYMACMQGPRTLQTVQHALLGTALTPSFLGTGCSISAGATVDATKKSSHPRNMQGGG